MDDKILKIVYTFFLGLMLSLFIGLGISTFYPAPKAPDFETTYKVMPGEDMDQDKLRELERKQKEYYEASKAYNRNVSIIALVGAVSLLGASLAFEKRNQVIANGVLLGGVFTLLYSIGRGLNGEDNRMTFIAVTVGLGVALYLGYRRFASSSQPTTKKKRR